MDIGISTACFYPMETENTLQLIKNAGYNKIEVFLEAESEYKEDFCKEFRKKADDMGIKIVSVHGFVAAYEPFLFSDYKRRRMDAMNVVKRIARSAEILGAKFYTFHGNRADLIRADFSFKEFGEVMDTLSETVFSYGVYLAWENVSWCQSGSPLFIKRSLEFITSKNLMFTLDIKQARRAGHDYTEYLNVFDRKLVNIHVNDFDKEHDCLLPCCGMFNFRAFINLMKNKGYDNNLIIEVYRSNFKSIDEIKMSGDRLNEILTNSDT